MALTILSSNRVEALQSRMSRQLAAQPLQDPFAQEIIVVPTYAMARWLNLRIAQQQGIAANNLYPQAGEWVWSLASGIMDGTPPQDPYSKSNLEWQVFNLLPKMPDDESFVSLRAYLADDHDGLKRWQLSQRIAEAFDRYQLYRPDWIRAWSSGEEHHWQARLWRRIVSARELRHRVDVIDGLISHLRDVSVTADVPERVNLFALSRLAPVYVELIHALASRTEVILYQHNPTDQYWADLVSQKTKARKRLQNPDHAQYFDTGNNLLASWGKQGQALQDLLLDLGTVTANEVDAASPADDDSVLHALQNSLFRLEPPSPGKILDDSVSVHICHSPMRECQVLHNHLLNLLDRHADLSSEDILVMVPEISRYAPYIEAVFQHDLNGKRPILAWNISDINIADGHPLVGVFLQLLKLPDSRFSRSEVLAYLECTEIRDCFGIDQQMLEDIPQLTELAQVRWGIDARQRLALGLPEIHENTWQQAWDRFFAGYAIADEGNWNGIAPIARIDTDSGVAIASFRHLFERLVYWQQKLAVAMNSQEWQQCLYQLVDEFFAPQFTDDELLQPLRDAISEFGQSGASNIDPALVSYWMEKHLSSTRKPGQLYSGGITFCGMQPMRNIPFPVICVLGMQDNAFPRKEHHAEFDLMHQQWRPGDPRKGEEDRYLMLETLLCARRYLYFSYCGRSLKDNSECQPSVLLRELLDTIDADFTAADGMPPAGQQISTEHPMQPFSCRNFEATPPGYDAFWHRTAQQLQTRRKISQALSWTQVQLADVADIETSIDLATLTRFFSHPIRYFFSVRLGIATAWQETETDEENFVLEGLHKWKLAEQYAANFLANRQNDALQFSAEGSLPHGRAATRAWETMQEEYQGLLDQLQPFRGKSPQSREIECEFDNGLLLYGEVGGYYSGTGLMEFSASKSVSSRSLLSLWLNHLALCASGQLASDETSQLLIPNAKGERFKIMEAPAARNLLGNYLHLYQKGLGYPLPVFPDTSYTWARYADVDAEAAMNKALVQWYGQDRYGPRGECHDEFIRLALHQNIPNPLDDVMFQELAQQIYTPAISYGIHGD